jgi:GxxExxY protein
MSLIDEELTYTLKGCFFDVQNQVGFGLPEGAYQEGLARAFATRGIPAQPHPTLTLDFSGHPVLELKPDFIVAERIVLELKALREEFAREHYIQLFSYLKASKIRLGFLVNFGRERVFDERRVFDEKPVVVEEHWDVVKGRIHGEERNAMAAARQALLTVGREYGLGYGEEIYYRLFAAVARHCGHALNLEPWAEPLYNDCPLGKFPIDCLVVDERVVCVMTALKDGLDGFDIARSRSYAKNLGLRFGLAANFGKDKLDLQAVGTV